MASYLVFLSLFSFANFSSYTAAAPSVSVTNSVASPATNSSSGFYAASSVPVSAKPFLCRTTSSSLTKAVGSFTTLYVVASFPVLFHPNLKKIKKKTIMKKEKTLKWKKVKVKRAKKERKKTPITERTGFVGYF